MLRRRRRIPVAPALIIAALAVILTAAACGNDGDANTPRTLAPQAAIDATLASFFAAPAATADPQAAIDATLASFFAAPTAALTTPAAAGVADAAASNANDATLTPIAPPAAGRPTTGAPLPAPPTPTPANAVGIAGAVAVHPPTPTMPPVTTPATATMSPSVPMPTPVPSPVSPNVTTFGDLTNAPYLEQEQPGAANIIKSLPWVADGLTAAEAAGAAELVDLAAFHHDAFTAIAGQQWVAAGAADTKTQLLEDLRAIGQQVTTAAPRISRMSFLHTLEPADFTAMRALRRLAFTDQTALDGILEHPTLRNGINDDWAKIVALLHGVNRVNPALIDTLLNPQLVTLEERTINLPLSGETLLAIIRTDTGARRSMDLLEHSVRNAELFMKAPLPTNYVAVLYGPAVAGAFAGTNFETHIVILPDYDVDDGSSYAAAAGHIIAHEVAHYYWSGNANWIDEGASEFLAAVSEFLRTGKAIAPSNSPCAMTRAIQTLDAMNLATESAGFECNYSLGERLFIDLYHSMMLADFQRDFIKLYHASQVDDPAVDDRDGTAVGIAQLRQSFPDDDDRAKTVIARWYDGAAAYEDRTDTGPVDPELPDLNGRIDAAYISAAENGPALSRFSAAEINSVVWLNLEFSYQFDAGSRETMLEVAEYYDDGFTYNRRHRNLRVASGYIGGTQYYSLGPLPPNRWAPGRYWVYVYNQGRKIAEVAFEVTP